MSFFLKKKVLVTGGTGLIGRQLVDLLNKKDANVTVVSLDRPKNLNNNVKFIKADLRSFENCMKVCKGQEIIFHLAGVKGSPDMTQKKPASFLVPTITFSFNMMEAARKCNVEKFLFTSSIGVYSPAKIFYEEDVWKTFPSDNDKFAGWAKRLCELQAESYKIEYGLNNISIVRPANVYGPYDNFDINNAMVIPSLISKAISADSEIEVWGDGSPIRDFIFSKDVAIGMMKIVELGITEPINLGSGTGVSIKDLVNTILNHIPNKNLKLRWNKNKPTGDLQRVMDTNKARSYNIKPSTTLDEGIAQTINWYLENMNFSKNKFNYFSLKK